SERKPLREYIRQLETDQPLEVDGYEWSGKLWRESLECEAAFGLGDEDNGAWSGGRPFRLVKLERSAAPLVSGSSLGFVVSLNPDLSTLFAENVDWMVSAVAKL
ncbi:MAG: hypothetical protein JOZ87_23400, partial [Chloroflexi bacterium]|nr:hypothetical protein [Chloroflexota bacterium]